MNFADTNWIEPMYVAPDPHDRGAIGRRKAVLREMKRRPFLKTSSLVDYEVWAVFHRRFGPKPPPWEVYQRDCEARRIEVCGVDETALLSRAREIHARHGHLGRIGALDVLHLSAAELIGCDTLYSFDSGSLFRALALARRMRLVPGPTAADRAAAAKLRG
ncbi:MAG TPA: PIN domain-containing protein [Verrucomicrobiota bacterium]|nr:PIN domain-containing protein [Verrucomicrobiota bacterium]